MNLVEEAPAKEAETTEAVKGGGEEEKEEKGRGRSPAKEKKKKKRKKGRSSGEEKSSKAKEKKGSSGQGHGTQELEKRVHGHRHGSRPQGQEESGRKSRSQGEEEEELIRKFVHEQSKWIDDRGERRAFRRDSKSEEDWANSSRCPHYSGMQRDGQQPAELHGGHLGPIRRSSSTHMLPVLPSSTQLEANRGQSREALTLSWCLDLLVQGRVAEAADGLMQRLKAIEMSAQGASWSISQRIELVPLEKPIISSRTEAREAIKESKEENRTRAEASKGKGKSKWPGSWRDTSWHQEKGKGKDSKGKGKKGKEKDAGKKSDS